MGLLSGLKALAGRAVAGARTPRAPREAAWVVTIEDDEISVADPEGQRRSIAKADLAAVLIETNDSGPWGSDFWWLLLAADKSLGGAFPQGATGEKAAMEWLMALPGFDHAAMITASGSTSNAFFTVWER